MAIRWEIAGGEFPEKLALGAWAGLMEDVPNATPFQSPDWQRSWSTYLAGRSEPLWLTVWEGDDLCGVWSLIIARGCWNALRPAGIGVSDYLDPLVRPGYEESFQSAFLALLEERKDVHLVDLHQQRSTTAIQSLHSTCKPITQARCLVLHLPESFEVYLSTLSKSLRYDAKFDQRSAFASGDATVETIRSPDAMAPALDAFFSLHKKRWVKRGLPGAFAFAKVRRFHHAYCRQAIQSGALDFNLLKSQGEIVGALYGLRGGNSAFFYQSGFDPAHKSLSPGTVLVSYAIKRSIDEGCTYFDFLRGDEAYKKRWRPQETRTNLRLLHARPGALAASALQWNLWSSDIDRRIRNRLEGTTPHAKVATLGPQSSGKSLK